MIKTFQALLFALGLALTGCATGPFSASPEAQIEAGAHTLTVTTTLATVLLKNDKITVSQAKSYRVMLGAASTALDEANGTLLACRKTTLTDSTSPADPCQPAVADVIKLALDSIAGVKRTLDAK